jgi:hypothetical protein
MAARMGSASSKRVSRPETGGTSTSSVQAVSGQKRMVWRISTAAPLGEWVDPSRLKSTSTKPEPAEVSTGGFLSSSFDLLRGTDVQEMAGDTVPDELLDEFFPELVEKKTP